jgi:hypothetical protein
LTRKPCTFAPFAPVNQKSSAGFLGGIYGEPRHERVVLVRDGMRCRDAGGRHGGGVYFAGRFRGVAHPRDRVAVAGERKGRVVVISNEKFWSACLERARAFVE